MRCSCRTIASFFALWALVAGPVRGDAQTAERIYRVAYLTLTAQGIQNARRWTLPILEREGFVEGRNLVFDGRYGAAEQLPALARELLAGRPDVVFAVGGVALRAASGATQTIPIVAFGSDPVALGLAASYARPGGNVTGVVILGPELDGKRLQLLHEAVPTARRVAVLFAAEQPSRLASDQELQRVAAASGLQLLDFTVASPADYATVFTAIRAAGAQSLVISAAPMFDRDITMLAGLAREARLPTICEWASHAREGCLLGYGPERDAMRHRTADQVVQILRGARVAELPIEVPARFDLAVNLAVAKALGVTLSATVIARADEVIE